MLRRIELELTKIVTVFLCLMMLAVIWLYPVLAAAQDAPGLESTNAAQDISLLVAKIIFSVLSLLTTWLVTKAIGYFEKKTKIDIPASTEDLLHKWADKGIGYANEKSHQAIQKVGKKLTGSEKLEIALKFVIGMSKQYELPSLAEDKLTEYIESKLGLDRKDAGVLLEEATVPNVLPDNG
jgi:hypothetical protein